MTRRIALTGLLVALGQMPSAAQPPENVTIAGGVVLREASDVTFFEHAEILARRALVPGARVVAPLHAYDSDLACETDRVAALLGHDGSAALVTTVGENMVAFYHRTVDDALRAVEDQRWCTPAERNWYFATTLPLRERADQHYVSLDVERVEAQLARVDDVQADIRDIATQNQEQESASHLWAAYRGAIADAIVAEPHEISDRLTPVLPGQEETRWEEIDGEEYVSTVTWASWDGYNDRTNTFMELKQEVWTTLVPQVREFCSGLEVRDLDLRLEQLLGLPPGNGKTVFVEMWVKPDDLFRPCPDSEIDDNHCDLSFPAGTDAEHMAWFDRLRATLYDGNNGYPWTRLGYTYDWGSSSGEVGPSEYVIRKGARVRVGLLEATSTYCQR